MLTKFLAYLLLRL